jgi:manganese oxidase
MRHHARCHVIADVAMEHPHARPVRHHVRGDHLRNAGLIGAIVITRRGMARDDGSPKDVDHEFVTLFMAFNESQSWYLDHNIETYTSDPN